MKEILILSLLFGLITNVAYAQQGAAVDGTAIITGDAEAAIEITNEINVDADSSMEVNANTTGGTVDVQSNTSIEAESTTNSDDRDQSNSEKASNTSNININFSVKSSSNADTSVKRSSQVFNVTDLQSYATVVVQENETVENIEAQQNKLTVTYKSKAKLFGFIPLTIKNRAEVTLNESTNGSVKSTVKVKFPWYRILLKAERKARDTESDIKAKVDSAVSSHLSVNAQAHAKALEVVESTVKAKSTTSVN